jgi:DNA primase
MHFSKRRFLYGLSEAEIANDSVLVVEGYFDVLTLHQAGFTNTVGLLGSEITAEQVAILNNLAREIVFIFDGDAGGQSGLIKALKAPLKAAAIKAVLLPDCDPDEFLREGRQAELETLIERAKPLHEAIIEILVRRKDREGLESLTEEIIKMAAAIPDALDASRFAHEGAAAFELPAWALEEKVLARREKKEKIGERKRQLEKFLVSELMAKPDLFPVEKLASIKDLFDEGEQKQFLISRILKRA